RHRRRLSEVLVCARDGDRLAALGRSRRAARHRQAREDLEATTALTQSICGGAKCCILCPPSDAPVTRRDLQRHRRSMSSWSRAQYYKTWLIPNPIDQNPWAHWRSPMDMMRQG